VVKNSGILKKFGVVGGGKKKPIFQISDALKAEE
jgi:hypothetical protein